MRTLDIDQDLLVAIADALPRWMKDAACVEHPDLDWFPNRGATDETRRVCEGCIVRGECLDYALTHRIEHGVWAGTTRNQRKQLRARRQIAAG